MWYLGCLLIGLVVGAGGAGYGVWVYKDKVIATLQAESNALKQSATNAVSKLP